MNAGACTEIVIKKSDFLAILKRFVKFYNALQTHSSVTGHLYEGQIRLVATTQFNHDLHDRTI
jgi:hypothetical protein